MALGLHQGLEYILAIALAITAVHISGRAELALLAGAVALAGLAALTDGPLAAFRVVPPKAHRVLEVLVGAVLVLLPLVSLRHPSAVGIGLLELAGLVLLRLAYVGVRPARPPRRAKFPVRAASVRAVPVRTVSAGTDPVRPDQIFMGQTTASSGVTASAMGDFTTGDQPSAPSGGAVSGTALPETGAAERPDPDGSRAGSVLNAGARAAGKLTGRARRKVGEVGPVADELLGKGAHRLGTAVGRRSARKSSS